jgi:hypothetical protein
VSNTLPAQLSAQPSDLATPAVKTRQRDQWVCWWSLPIFYNLFGLIFVYLGKLMPPPKPGLTTAEIVEFIQTNAASMQVAWVLLTLSLGFASMSSGLIVVQMKRMSISPVLPYAYLAALAVAALPGCLPSATRRSSRCSTTPACCRSWARSAASPPSTPSLRSPSSSTRTASSPGGSAT